MNFGGPVWHASTSHSDPVTLRRVALIALDGVGSALLGEWYEWTGRAFHVRRRLRPEEAEKVGPVLDIRGTGEARLRLHQVAKYLPRGWTE
jgi:hypothetical protein